MSGGLSERGLEDRIRNWGMSFGVSHVRGSGNGLCPIEQKIIQLFTANRSISPEGVQQNDVGKYCYRDTNEASNELGSGGSQFIASFVKSGQALAFAIICLFLSTFTV